jgi:hypothetical protein
MTTDTYAYLAMSARIDTQLLERMPSAELRRALTRGRPSAALEAHRERIRAVLKARGERA